MMQFILGLLALPWVLVTIGCSGNGSTPAGSPDASDSLNCGIARVDITPPAGYRMSGYFRERLSTGTSNPLWARALVFQQGDTKVAFVSCDLIGLSREITSIARRRVSGQTGIPLPNILISATHTHTGPLYFGALRDYFHEAAVDRSGTDPYEQIDYPERLASAIVEAVLAALADLGPVELRAGSGLQEGLSFNRRFRMKDGTVRFNPGVLNPDIVETVGPTDPQLGVIFLHRGQSGPPVGAVVNFALHLDTVGGTEYAADYPYFLERALRAAYGSGFSLLFATGTCGDLNHIDVTRRERLDTQFIGETLAETVRQVSTQLETLGAPHLEARSATVEVPLQQFGPEEVEWARRAMAQVGTQDLPFLEQVRAYKILSVSALQSGTMPLEVQVIRLGSDLAVVGLPGEVFVELGLEIKRSSPFAQTLVVELCQDAPGYIPTSKAFAEGSYETVNSRISPGGGEQMAALAIQLLNELGPGPTQKAALR